MRTEATYAWLTCLLALAACTDATSPLSEEGTGGGIGDLPAPEFDVAYTERIGQLTGTKQNPLETNGVGIVGTDLGISYERNGELVFLFGDSWTDPNTWAQPAAFENLNLDSVAHTSAARPNGTPRLEWFTREGSSTFQPFVVPKAGTENEFHEMGAFSLPVEGISNGLVDYLFFHVTPLQKDEMGQLVRDELGRPIALPAISVVAEANTADGFRSITTRHEQQNTNFKSVSTVLVADDVYIFGARDYRASAIYLAKAPLSTITDRSTWTYYAGAPGVKFVATEDDEAHTALIPETCVGELSVRKHPTDDLYIMTYNCGANGIDGYPHEIRLRTARHPEGPWSEPQVIFKQNEGNSHFVHSPSPLTAQVQGPYDDGLQAPYFQNDPGDVYGPYLIPQWFRDPAPGVHEIVYTLSSWNPYQVHLMRTVLTDPGVTATRPAPIDKSNPIVLQNADFVNGSIEGWTPAVGDAWDADAFQRGSDGWALTTRVTGAEVIVEGVKRGRISQKFDVGPQTILSFEVMGGAGAVKLIHDDQIVRETRPAGTDQTLPARWDLSSLRGESVELVVEDGGFMNFDYISVTPFTFSMP